MARKKVGLVLGSGGARGFAHIGVIKSLLRHKIPIDMIAGSSAGALIGGVYAMSEDIDEVERQITGLDYKDIFTIFSDPMLGGGLLKGEKMLELLKDLVGENKIEKGKVPFLAVATDLNTAETVIWNKGGLAEAIRASSSIPLVFQPYKTARGTMVDGGLSCPVPVEAVKKMGAEVVIAVNLDSIFFLPENRKIDGNTSVVSVLENSYELLRYHLAKKEVREADILIEPKTNFINDLDFAHGKELILDGEAAVEEKLEEIRAAIS